MQVAGSGVGDHHGVGEHRAGFAIPPVRVEQVDVELGFTTKQTYSPGLALRPSNDHYEGVVTAILENGRWVIDDYMAMYANDDLQRLSAGYPECKGGLWVGENPY